MILEILAIIARFFFVGPFLSDVSKSPSPINATNDGYGYFEDRTIDQVPKHVIIDYNTIW